MKELLLVLLLVTGSATAAEVPNETTKKQVLLEAYRANGNSMVRWGSMDMTNPNVTVYDKDEIVCGWVKGEASGQLFYECKDFVQPMKIGAPPAPAEPEPVKAPEKVKTAAAEPAKERNVCTRHGLRKVWSRDGERWNCRR